MQLCGKYDFLKYDRPEGQRFYTLRVASTVGVYIIKHVTSGVFYVGSATALGIRVASHLHMLHRNIHYNTRLMNAYNDSQNLEVYVMICDDREMAYSVEQEIITQYLSDGTNLCVNVAENARSPNKGVTRSIESRQKHSVSTMGKTMSADVRAKISATNKLIVKGPEWRRNISLGQIGKVLSVETRAKISAAQKGKPRTGWIPRGEEAMTENRIASLAKQKGENHPSAQPVEIHGIVYAYGKAACEVLNLSPMQLKWRLNSDKFPSFKRIKKGG